MNKNNKLSKKALKITDYKFDTDWVLGRSLIRFFSKVGFKQSENFPNISILIRFRSMNFEK